MSFEHGILDECIVLARQHTPYQHIRKTKIGLPMSNKEETARRLQDCKKAIGNIDRAIPISPFERDAMLEKDEEQREWRLSEKRIERLRDAAAAASLCIEHSLKVLVALEDRHVPKTHSTLDLIALLPDFISSQISQLLTEQEWKDVGDWRQAGTYIDAWEKLELSEMEVVENIERYYHTITVILPFCVEEYEKHYGTSRFTDGLRKDLMDLDKRFSALDLFSGGAAMPFKGW
ncbi:HEPN domain-containing protein [Candidatus Poriferisocius sp.]|uniref:HEPN domain-containing protein n=1 Tax=Candidatus Poriferisocius sp. TaxID=3101276 RepID=UPI003B01A56C